MSALCFLGLVLFFQDTTALQAGTTPQTTQPARPAAGALTPTGQQPARPSAISGDQQAATGPTFNEGPLRVELLGMAEMRVRMLEAVPGAPKDSDLRMQFRLRGERIEEVSRIGNIILTEAVDNSGKALVAADTYTEQEKTNTRVVTLPPDRLRGGGLQLPVKLATVPARAATMIKKLRGTVRVLFAGPAEQITIVAPQKFQGKNLDHPRLKEIGIEVRVVAPEDLNDAGPLSRGIALLIKTKKDYIRNASFADGAMRQVRSREAPLNLANGESATLYVLEPGQLSDELQLVLDVFPSVEEKVVPVELNDFQLP